MPLRNLYFNYLLHPSAYIAANITSTRWSFTFLAWGPLASIKKLTANYWFWLSWTRYHRIHLSREREDSTGLLANCTVRSSGISMSWKAWKPTAPSLNKKWVNMWLRINSVDTGASSSRNRAFSKTTVPDLNNRKRCRIALWQNTFSHRLTEVPGCGFQNGHCT